MAVRVVEWKKPYTWGIAIEITEDKVINLKLRDENNLIQYDEWDNEIYVDLQLDDEIEPTDELPVWITTGRIIVDNQRDYTGTILVAKTTSGDLIKFVYADNWNIYIDNWTWTFKQIYLKADVDTLINALRVEIKNYVDAHDTVVSSTAPTEPYEGQLWYDTANDELKTYDGTQWNSIGGGSTYSAWTWIDITNDVISIDPTVVATQTDLLSKQDSLTASTWISIDSSNNISNTLPGATVSSTAPSNPSQWDQWYDTANDVLKTYDWTQWNAVWWSSSWAAWGQITGTLSDQTDLQNALDAKQDILTAWNWITISSANRTRSASTLNISVDTAVVATQSEMSDKQDVLTAGNNITIWDLPLYNHIEESQQMWPCDSGFKLPTSAEWANLINAWITLGAWTASGATDFMTYLHIPACHRIKYDWTIDSASYYWTCNQYTNSNQAFNLDLLYMNAADYSAKSNGFPIRAFARTPVTPTSSWTTVYAGTGWAWIFYNSTDGIISISADGTTWISIQDKNVGATTVYNYWDTMSEANCWKLFQWGNNYWFPYAWASSTSGAAVNASWYWPGNYFSWSTFIAINGSWDSSSNSNLWWWASWWTMIIDVPTGETAPTIYAKVAVQAYRPSYPTIGMLWYKTDVSTLYVYDWTYWRSI